MDGGWQGLEERDNWGRQATDGTFLGCGMKDLPKLLYNSAPVANTPPSSIKM